jgi:hypothetical protein
LIAVIIKIPIPEIMNNSPPPAPKMINKIERQAVLFGFDSIIISPRWLL